MELEAALAHYFGFKQFRRGQKEIIQTLLAGESALGMLPTGQGKSLCYQLTGYLLEGTVIIISPLISLMEDQVLQLQQNGEKKAIALNSLLSFSEKDYVLQNLQQYKFVFMSPEMFLSPTVLAKIKTIPLALIVVDEAHCISQWGIDFRPEYLKLADGIQALSAPLILALTATATVAVRQDIQQLLFQKEVPQYVQSVDRKNIRYFVYHEEKLARLQELLKELDGCGLIYCSTRKKVEELYQILRGAYEIAFYHGGLSGQERRSLQQQFLAGEVKLLIATNAFGMGINKPDIRFVIHYDLPDSLENYLQEVGRAGRDGLPSQGILLYEKGDEKIHHFLQQQTKEIKGLYQLKQQHPELIFEEPLLRKWEVYFPQQSEELVALLTQREITRKKQLQDMLDYLQLTTCRRSYLLSYFQEELLEKNPQCCDNDGAQLLIKEASTITEPINNSKKWTEILKILFKNS